MKSNTANRTNRHPDGKSRVKAILTPEIVQIIRASHLDWNALAAEYRVGKYTIRDIRQYRTWAWVD